MTLVSDHGPFTYQSLTSTPNIIVIDYESMVHGTRLVT